MSAICSRQCIIQLRYYFQIRANIRHARTAAHAYVGRANTNAFVVNGHPVTIVKVRILICFRIVQQIDENIVHFCLTARETF